MDGNLKQGLPTLDTGKLIIDTDAGADDAVALFLALGYEAKQPNSSARIIAITCVFGNTNVSNVAMNVLKVLKTANRLDVSSLTSVHQQHLSPD
jgi:inosine-uridine nucleoside N-ribohydrolase